MIGDTVVVLRELPELDYSTGEIQVVVAAGSEDRVAVTGGDNLYVDVDEDLITIILGPQIGNGGPFDHFIRVKDIDWLGDLGKTIESINIVTNIAGFDQSRISFTPDSVTFQLRDLTWQGSQFVYVALNPVPEPASAALGLIGAVSLALRRRRH